MTLTLLLCLFSCKQERSENARSVPIEACVDLSDQDAVSAYLKMEEIVRESALYIGALITVRGIYMPYYVSSLSAYRAVLSVQDAPNCCAIAIEFELIGAPPLPDGYPEKGASILLRGTFEMAEEGGVTYPRFSRAEIL